MVLKVTKLSKNELASLFLGAMGEIFEKVEPRIDSIDNLCQYILDGNSVHIWALNPNHDGEYNVYTINLSSIKKGFNKAIKCNPYNLSFFMDDIERTSICCECIMQYIIYGKIKF